ncbi:MAG: S26 family signal peptidase [Acidimicrobiales bacterium]
MTLVAKSTYLTTPGPSHRGRWRAVVATVAAGVPVAGIVWSLARLVSRVAVEGDSMQPALAPGDRLLVVAWPVVRPGDVVAVEDPRGGRLLVKRVTAVDRRRRLVSVEGDNREASTDSRVFGPVPNAAIAGKAVYRYAPRPRAGPVASNR